MKYHSDSKKRFLGKVTNIAFIKRKVFQDTKGQARIPILSAFCHNLSNTYRILAKYIELSGIISDEEKGIHPTDQTLFYSLINSFIHETKVNYLFAFFNQHSPFASTNEQDRLCGIRLGQWHARHFAPR